jgi:hypothetical protein
MLILVAFYDTHELRWGYSLLPATTRGRKSSSPKMMVSVGQIPIFVHVENASQGSCLIILKPERLSDLKLSDHHS